MKNIFILCFSSLTLTAACAQEFSRVLAGNTSVDNNGFSLAPFSYGGSRYQQVYNAVQFADPTLFSGQWISNISFRLDATNGTGGPRNYGGIQINLSTTQRQPGSLDPVFANNVGTNDTIVFGPASQSAFFSFPPGGSFDLRFSLSTPFFYNPADGNLLLDIRMIGAGDFPTSLDALQGAPLTTSSVFSEFGGLSGTPNDLGLVTRMSGLLVPIPEPSTYALFALGAGVFLFMRKARHQ